MGREAGKWEEGHEVEIFNKKYNMHMDWNMAQSVKTLSAQSEDLK